MCLWLNQTSPALFHFFLVAVSLLDVSVLLTDQMVVIVSILALLDLFNQAIELARLDSIVGDD